MTDREGRAQAAVGRTPLKVGMIGVSEGNGHPFSFSAIINGYSDEGMARSGWDGIHAYLRQRDVTEFGGLGMRVTHAWTQEPDTTQRLAAACGIDEVVAAPAEMLGHVDAVVIARDDHENHAELAMPFLDAGLPVFVDKPLTLDLDELRTFAPYLRSGQLTSCSGMRFAKELDAPRADWPAYGTVRLVRGAILNDWARYGVHLVDGIFGVTRARPVNVRALPSPHASVAAEMDDGSLLQLDALGDVGRCFRFEFYGTGRISAHEVTDNFSMFRRLMHRFARSLRGEGPVVDPEDALRSLRFLVAGRLAMKNGEQVSMEDVRV